MFTIISEKIEVQYVMALVTNIMTDMILCFGQIGDRNTQLLVCKKEHASTARSAMVPLFHGACKLCSPLIVDDCLAMIGTRGDGQSLFQCPCTNVGCGC